MGATMPGVADHGAGLDWHRIGGDLDAHGCAVVRALLSADECVALAATYADDARFRNRVVMARHGFGRGEYKYFGHPLPGLIVDLRTRLYPPLARIANDWNQAMGIAVRYPAALADFLARCHRAGQRQPTPLLLSYGEGECRAPLTIRISRRQVRQRRARQPDPHRRSPHPPGR